MLLHNRGIASFQYDHVAMAISDDEVDLNAAFTVCNPSNISSSFSIHASKHSCRSASPSPKIN